MRKLALLAAAAAGAALVYTYFDRRAMALARARFSAPTDASLAREVRDVLSRIVADPEAVHLTVHEGTVTLRGAIDRSRRDRALRAALAVPGVKAVLNQLDIDSPPPLDDELPEVPPGLRPN
jgi:osmotically-inducible protein OsmY